jgi:hypothetical protein
LRARDELLDERFDVVIPTESLIEPAQRLIQLE